MHPVDAWQVLFLVVMMLATGGACGFRLGVDYVLRRRRTKQSAQSEGDPR